MTCVADCTLSGTRLDWLMVLGLAYAPALLLAIAVAAAFVAISKAVARRRVRAAAKRTD